MVDNTLTIFKEATNDALREIKEKFPDVLDDKKRCKFCDALKLNFYEVEMQMPRGKVCVEMCDECCENFYTDPDFGYQDPE